MYDASAASYTIYVSPTKISHVSLDQSRYKDIGPTILINGSYKTLQLCGIFGRIDVQNILKIQ